MSSSSQAGANAVPDTQLGLSNEEIQLLRQGQRTVAAAAGSTSSRAASRASSQGLLMMDSSSLAALGRHFDRVMQHIQQQLEYLFVQSETVTMYVQDRAASLIDNADAEIARFHEINQQIDELELDYDRIRHIRDIVRELRRRAEELDRELERSSGSSSSRRDRHGHQSSSSSSAHRTQGHGRHRS